MNLTGLTNYHRKRGINHFTGLCNYYKKDEPDSKCQSAFKQSASSWNSSCIYDNLRIIVAYAFDGKWLYLSAATATPLNGVYFHSWHRKIQAIAIQQRSII